MAIQALQQTFFAWLQNIHLWTEILRTSLNPIKSILSYLSATNQFPLKTDNLKNFKEASSLGDEIPFGVEYVISIVDVFVPQTIFT